MSAKDKKYDDLTIIKGVGAARQTWFRQVFKVETLHDLASLSADEVETRLKDDGRIVSRSEVEQWLAQAQQLAPDLPSSQARETATIAIIDQASMEKRWEWIKAFVVEFCVLKSADEIQKQEIRVYPLRISKKGDWLDNGSSKKTPFIFDKSEKLYAWLLGQLDEPAWQEQPLTPTIAAPPPKPQSIAPQTELPSIESLPTVDIVQINSYQPTDLTTPTGIGMAGQPFVGHVSSKSPFALEVTFAISEEVSDEIARQVGFKADFYVRGRSREARAFLGETTLDALFADRLTYTARLPRAMLKPGQYHLGVQVKLRSQPPCVTHLEVPMFQVV